MARFLLVIASCGAALLVLEGMVRVTFPHARDHVLPGRLFDFDEDLGWKLKPDRQVTHRSRYFEVVYTTNASGFRDRPHTGARRSGGSRLLLYGDSQVFGWGVPEEARFSNLLEAHVPSLEIWNLAVPAWGLDQQVLAYQRDGASLSADEVAFFVSESTLRRTRRDFLAGRRKPLFARDGHGQLQVLPPKRVGVNRLLYEALSHLYLPQLVYRRLGTLAVRVRDLGGQTIESDRFFVGGPAGSVEEGILILARDIAEARGHRITVLAALPQPARRTLQAFCDRQGIAFLAIDVDTEVRTLVHGPDDPHWNRDAHRLLADQILSQLTPHLAAEERR